ncbi:MAG: acyl-protein synthetase [Shewanella sp.]|uniref:LuxE/PaaK family acyltransferase n=1 Tax=Shewanella sp. TaxID=50422 RepID=UPI0030021695
MLFDLDPYSIDKQTKHHLLCDELSRLTLHHQQHCPEFGKLIQAQWPSLSLPVKQLSDLPYLSVRLFKQLALKSIPDKQVFKTLYSSGTMGTSSRIMLDNQTAAVQSKILVKIMQQWLGKARLPMLIIDHPSVVKDRSNFSARGAGIQGLSFMGRNHCYALNDDMSINWSALEEFCNKFADGPVLIFGFTFMVWQHFFQQLIAHKRKINLPKATLVHSGGWKKLISQAIDNNAFKKIVNQTCGVSKVHNFYGMVEQIGAIFVECEYGHLHCPSYADVIIRRTHDWSVADYGEVGVIQLLSTLPKSYPGYSLLTEDKGVLIGEDDCPCHKKGKYFNVLGRLPQAEARGCSDTFEVGKSS